MKPVISLSATRISPFLYLPIYSSHGWHIQLQNVLQVHLVLQLQNIKIPFVKLTSGFSILRSIVVI